MRAFSSASSILLTTTIVSLKAMRKNPGQLKLPKADRDGEELAVAFLAFFFVVGPLAPLGVEVRATPPIERMEQLLDEVRAQ